MSDKTIVNQKLKKLIVQELYEQADFMEAEIIQTQQNIVRMRESAETMTENDIEKTLFTVDIYDPWDSTAIVPCSCKVTERGLQRAVESAEREYMRRSQGHLRTDGVLQYTVVAHPQNLYLTVPRKMWLVFSRQNKTHKKTREQS